LLEFGDQGGAPVVPALAGVGAGLMVESNARSDFKSGAGFRLSPLSTVRLVSASFNNDAVGRRLERSIAASV
jgi:hypothetical protein